MSSCDFVEDGQYQSCETCEGYIVCKDGEMGTKNCKGSRTWDDSLKKCQKEVSTTCNKGTLVNDYVGQLEDVSIFFCILPVILLYTLYVSY